MWPVKPKLFLSDPLQTRFAELLALTEHQRFAEAPL